MERASFTLPGGVGFGNAVRRTLLSDIESWAPCKVTLHENTTVQTDEYLGHRIGLIPFRSVGNGDTMTLDRTGPCTITAADVVGPAFEAVHPEIEILYLAKKQRLRMTIHFDQQAAGKHARYCVCAAVGMETLKNGHTKISFSVNTGRPPTEVMLEALDRLDQRVQRALHALANQPATPPTSFC